jgi:DNA (cytosine-5)-methyltransferase 1
MAYEDARGVLDEALLNVVDRYAIFGPIVLDAANFGAATKRRRLFVIGIHNDFGDAFSDEDLAPFQRSAASVRVALADLADASALPDDKAGFDRWKVTKKGRPHEYARPLRSSNGIFTSHRIVEHRLEVAARFADVPQGGMDKVGRHPRLAWNGQCPTLRAGTGSERGSYQAVRPLHPDLPRVITVREAARLQGFPDQHLFHPTIWHSFRMIGNSVSPIISEAIFGAIAAKLGRQRQLLAA